MSTDLQNVRHGELANLVENPYEQDSSNMSGVVGSGYLPFLQLCSGNSEAVLDGKVETNHFAIRQGTEYMQLGKEVDVFFLGWRPRAWNFKDMTTSFNTKSETFKRIKAESDKKGQNNPNQYGPEFLLYVPEKDMYVTFFMGGISARNESGNVFQLFMDENRRFQPGQGTLKSKKVNNDKNTWFVPYVTTCSAILDQPDPNKVRDLLMDFFNPKEKAEPEKAENVQQVER